MKNILILAGFIFFFIQCKANDDSSELNATVSQIETYDCETGVVVSFDPGERPIAINGKAAAYYKNREERLEHSYYPNGNEACRKATHGQCNKAVDWETIPDESLDHYSDSYCTNPGQMTGHNGINGWSVEVCNGVYAQDFLGAGHRFTQLTCKN